MRDEYRAITDAGLLLQIDAPEMCIDRAREFRGRPLGDFLARAELWVEALNHALEGIPAEQVRFHICWGNGEGPHVSDIPLSDIVEVMLKVNCAAYSVEASNPRHAHEWKLWRDVKLPDGKVLIPGVIDSVTNFVEHPELVATASQLREHRGPGKIAGTDCGFDECGCEHTHADRVGVARRCPRQSGRRRRFGARSTPRPAFFVFRGIGSGQRKSANLRR